MKRIRTSSGHSSARGVRKWGAVGAYTLGGFPATVEGHSMTARRPGLVDPTFWGGYVVVGMLVTGGDTTAYLGGAFDRGALAPFVEGRHELKARLGCGHGAHVPTPAAEIPRQSRR